MVVLKNVVFLVQCCTVQSRNAQFVLDHRVYIVYVL